MAGMAPFWTLRWHNQPWVGQTFPKDSKQQVREKEIAKSEMILIVTGYNVTLLQHRYNLNLSLQPHYIYLQFLLFYP